MRCALWLLCLMLPSVASFGQQQWSYENHLMREITISKPAGGLFFYNSVEDHKKKFAAQVQIKGKCTKLR